MTEVGFEQKPEDDEPEPLRMEHFYFPLGIWLTGHVLSVIFLLAEVFFFNCCSKGRNVEAGGATQSIPRLEVQHNTDVEDIEL